eukprot:scaffold3.g6220.t1
MRGEGQAGAEAEGQSSGAAAAGTAPHPALAGGRGETGRPTPQAIDMEAKLALARQKNREAQQRFRERQQEKRAQQAVELEAASHAVATLQRENEALALHATVLEKMLAVRDAMLAVFGHTAGGAAAAAAAPLPAPMPHLDGAQLAVLQDSGRRLVSAVEHLPAESEIDALGAGLGDPAWGLRSDSDELASEAMLLVPSIPLPDNEVVRQEVLAMQSPDDMVTYWRAWQVDMCASWAAAQQAGFDEGSVRELQAVLTRMEQLWWHASHLKPSFLTHLAHVGIPTNSAAQPVWERMAAELLAELHPSHLVALRRAWQQYSKQLAKCAVGCAEWVRRLQALRVAEAPGSMHTAAADSLAVAQVAGHVAAAVQEEYLASMELIGTISQAAAAAAGAGIAVRTAAVVGRAVGQLVGSARP